MQPRCSLARSGDPWFAESPNFPRNLAADFLQYTCEQPEMKRKQTYENTKSARLSMKTKTNTLVGAVLFLLIHAAAPRANAQSDTLMGGVINRLQWGG